MFVVIFVVLAVFSSASWETDQCRSPNAADLQAWKSCAKLHPERLRGDRP